MRGDRWGKRSGANWSPLPPCYLRAADPARARCMVTSLGLSALEGRRHRRNPPNCGTELDQGRPCLRGTFAWLRSHESRRQPNAARPRIHPACPLFALAAANRIRARRGVELLPTNCIPIQPVHTLPPSWRLRRPCVASPNPPNSRERDQIPATITGDEVR